MWSVLYCGSRRLEMKWFFPSEYSCCGVGHPLHLMGSSRIHNNNIHLQLKVDMYGCLRSSHGRLSVRTWIQMRLAVIAIAIPHSRNKPVDRCWDLLHTSSPTWQASGSAWTRPRSHPAQSQQRSVLMLTSASWVSSIGDQAVVDIGSRIPSGISRAVKRSLWELLLFPTRVVHTSRSLFAGN